MCNKQVAYNQILKEEIRLCTCLFWEYFSLTTFSSRLGRTITLIGEVARETNLSCSPFAIVFFSGMLYLSQILIAVKQTLYSRELKSRICISSLHPHHQRHDYWQIGGSQISPTMAYFPHKLMLTGAAMLMKGVLWLPVCGSPANYSPTCSRHRCSILVQGWEPLITLGRTSETQNYCSSTSELSNRWQKWGWERELFFLWFWIHWPNRH